MGAPDRRTCEGQDAGARRRRRPEGRFKSVAILDEESPSSRLANLLLWGADPRARSDCETTTPVGQVPRRPSHVHVRPHAPMWDRRDSPGNVVHVLNFVRVPSVGTVVHVVDVQEPVPGTLTSQTMDQVCRHRSLQRRAATEYLTRRCAHYRDQSDTSPGIGAVVRSAGCR
jgi:hypothetical protein